ncbi:MAG: hypothetical protein AB8I08_04915 [Sandaracinaceae bacterium]
MNHADRLPGTARGVPRLMALSLMAACGLLGCDGCEPEAPTGPVCGREVHVSLDVPGTSPTALEERIVPVEDGLRLVEGVSRIETTLAPGHAIVTVTATPDSDPATVRAGVERSVQAQEDSAALEVRGELRVSRQLAFVEEPRPEDLGHRALVLTAAGPMLDSVGLDLATLAGRIRAELGDTPPSIEALQAIRVGGLQLDRLVTMQRAGGPRVEDLDGEPRFLRLGEGTSVTVNDCDAAPPVENMVRARIDTQEDNVSFGTRREMAAPLMAMARDAGHTAYLLLDLDVAAALSGRPAVRVGATEVVVLAAAPELAEAWRSRELPGAALTVDAGDVRRLRVSVEEAQSGAVLARMATSPEVAELLPSPRARGRMTASITPARAEAVGQTVDALEQLAAGSLAGIEVVPGLTLKGPALDTLRVGGDAEQPGVPLIDLLELTRTFDVPLSRADGRRVRQFEARILPETDRAALLNQILGR